MEKEALSIELETDYRFQKTEWRLQRVGWIVWGCIILAALLGFLGPGLFSETQSVASDSSLAVTYDRFVHYHHDTVLDVKFDLGSIGDTEFQMTIDRALLESIDIQRIDPAPKRSAVTGSGVVYVFEKEAQLQTGALALHVDYDRQGTVRGEIALIGHTPVRVTQFVFP